MFKLILLHISRILIIFILIIWIIIWGFSLKNYYNNSKFIENTEPIKILSNQDKQILSSCKISWLPEDLNQIIFKCWNITEKLEFAKLTSVEFPKKWECWYTESLKYLKNMIPYTYVLNVLYEKENVKYWYLIWNTNNYNLKIIEDWYWKYKEEWLFIENLIKAEENSKFLWKWNHLNCK